MSAPPTTNTSPDPERPFSFPEKEKTEEEASCNHRNKIYKKSTEAELPWARKILAEISSNSDVESITSITYACGALYQGPVDEDFQPHGRGTLLLQNSTIYQGLFKKGSPQEGRIQYPNRITYEGGVDESLKPHGKGFFVFQDRISYGGELQNGSMSGYGEFRNELGFTISGRWVRDSLIANISFLSNPVFLSSLLNETAFPSNLSSLGIFYEYYQEKNLYPEITSLFKETIRIYNLPQETSAKEIYEGLKEKALSKAYLLPLKSQAHMMLLEITQEESNVIFKIYNSGEGLTYHKKKTPREDSELSPYNHYQTMLQIQVPKEQIEEPLMQNLLEMFPSTKEIYETFLQIPEAHIVEQKAPIVWQKEQKGSNCTLRCVLVFLKHKLGKKNYGQMKLNLLQACQEAVLKSSNEQALLFLPFLQKKIHKRRAKLRNNITLSS